MAPASSFLSVMSAYQIDRPRRKFPIALAALVIAVVGLVAALVYFWPRLESRPPRIQLKPDTDAIGIAPLEIDIADAEAGVKSYAVTLSADGKETSLASEQLATPVREKKVAVSLAKVAGIKEGPATLRIVARDASLFRGNQTVVEKKLTLDLTPPTVGLVADDRYINFGGAGAIVYTASPDTVTSGVRIGAHFFPGFKGAIKGEPERFFALFAHPYDAKPDAKAVLVATDKAGNTRETPLVYQLMNVKYRKSTIALSDAFLQNKVVPLVQDVATRQAGAKEMFIAVNKRLRKANDDKITEVTRKATPQILWNGAFAQLSNSKVEANFADLRTYVYNNEQIDTAYHLGYDLSVTKQYPVEAANSGTAVFVGDLGIYGNTVILDHGLGLFTLYSHLSSMDVKVGDAVKERQVLGRTGETGLAAGDHLHYGVYLHGVAVLPVEWWDSKWINDNVAPKLAGKSSEAVVEEQRAARPRKGGGRKR